MTTNEPRTPDEIIAIDFNQLEPEARGRARGLMEAIAELGAVRKEITTAQDDLHALATAAAENAGLTFSQVQAANKFMPAAQHEKHDYRCITGWQYHKPASANHDPHWTYHPEEGVEVRIYDQEDQS